MDISVIIINYNTLGLTINCIESLYRHSSGVSFEVIVVDNNSSDESVKFLSRDNRIKFINSQENLGFGRANNLGYEIAKGKYIFLLNSDTIILNNVLKIFYDTMESVGQRIACLGSILKDGEGNSTHSFGKFPNWVDAFKLFSRRDNVIVEGMSSHFEVDYITGADLFIRRKIIEEVGFFDPDFFLYYEETDLQYRFNTAGYRSLIIEGPEIIHLEGISSKSSFRKKMNVTQGYLLYFKKRMNPISYLLFRFTLFLRRFPGTLKNNSFKEFIAHVRVLTSITLK